MTEKFVIKRGLKYWGGKGTGWTYAPTLAREYATVEEAMSGANTETPVEDALVGSYDVVPSPVRDHGAGSQVP